MRPGEDHGVERPSKESTKKLDQIIQNIFAKTGTLILQERMKVTPMLVTNSRERKISRWFQIDTDEIEDFREEFRTWKQCGGFENRPPPIIIETYIDTSRLKGGQSLVIVDENGKRWDVIEAMNSSDFSSDSSSGGRSKKSNTQLVLERWRVELKGAVPDNIEEFGHLLPTIYKKAIIFIRSIYTTTGILPAWKLARNSKSKGSHPALQIKCRVSSGDTRSSGFDPLRSPLYEGRGDVSTDYMFGLLEVPVGRFYASVSYRNNCDFKVVETESLLSSRIGLAISDDIFKPSLPARDDRRESSAEIGSLPYHRRVADITENQQRYGSLSTFHGEGPHGTSPISALRAIKSPGSDTTSPPDSRPASVEVPPHSLPINAPTRPSIRPDGTAGMAASLRGGPPAAVEIPIVGSPKPSATNRFSSSFTHRRNRASFGGASRAGDDDQTSSGKQSLASSLAQPGSGLLNEAGGGGSSGSFQTDDDNIQEFLKALESKRTLQSFEPTKKGESATKRTTAQLSKFHLMRESNNALTESLNSSMQLQPSSSSSSRQLANVPGMSVSSSPGKPLSPHTPHTPAIPSRLSENSSADYAAPAQAPIRARTGRASEIPASVPATLEGTTAIDIPLSPRPYPHARRSSSAAHQNRVLTDDDDAHRSLSLGADDREPPSLSALLGRHEAAIEDADGTRDSPILQAPADIRAADSSEMLRQGSSSAERETRPPGSLFSSSPYRRYGIGGGRGSSTPQSGNSSLTGTSGRYGRGYSRGGATGLGVTGAPSEETEEEPLLFDMSELGRELNRRSLEEARGGGNVGSAPERGGYDTSRGGSRRW
ncbi:hypothetical protein JX265_001271 [Neoarthrinium moseri]|uniref:Autophagy-related protein 13 n=2 Tax=Neoarthrinium moseri TaxID=1658444 RepID=A0A9P9WXT2_9PEZI|nr:hypothetical protein JX265_001271 [Neoarthrinium moseri]